MLSMHDSEEYVLQSIDAGARGYLLKDASREEFLKAIQTVMAGESYFSGELSNILLRRMSMPTSPAPSPFHCTCGRARQYYETAATDLKPDP